jgi:SAM-dependent methyltransferase
MSAVAVGNDVRPGNRGGREAACRSPERHFPGPRAGAERLVAPLTGGLLERLAMSEPRVAETPSGTEKFDAYADRYRSMMETSIKESGESVEYFAEYKLNCLLRLGAPTAEPILDFGAGTGSVTEQLIRRFESVTAYEPSTVSLDHARRRCEGVTCASSESELPDAHFSTAVCSGVLHHVPPAERRPLLARLRAKLRPGGRLFVFEHNPLNPLTRRAVTMCPFDDDAVLLWPWQLRPMFEGAGFRIERIDYIVFFPHALAVLRPLEPYLRRVVLGAQTLSVVSNPG